MTENETDQQDAADLPETVSGAPDWGGVPRAGGDNADATGGPPTDLDAGGEPTDAEAGGEAAAEPDAAEAGAVDAEGEDSTTAPAS